jgi:hypothetical protein
VDASTKLCIRNCRFTIAGRAPAVSMMVLTVLFWRIARCLARGLPRYIEYTYYERFRELFQLSTRLSHHYRPFIVEHQYSRA